MKQGNFLNDVPNQENVADRQAGRREGEWRKDKAHRLLEARRARYVRQARRELLIELIGNGTATIDDVRERVELPAGMDPRTFGAVPGPLVRAGIIRQDGHRPTSRPVSHARPIAVWRLIDEEKAREWLLAHPPWPDDGHEKSPVVAPTEPSADDRQRELNGDKSYV